jgi:hypothetical protein
VQVAGGNDVTDAEALRQARQLEHGLIIDPRHPLARTGFGEGTVRDPTTEALGEAYAEAYGELALGAAGGPLARGAPTAGRAAVEAGKAIARNPTVQLNTLEGMGNFARGYRHGRGLRPPGRPYGGSVGAYAGYYTGYGIGVIQRSLGIVDDVY